MKDAKGHGSNQRGGLSVPDQHQHKIAVDTVKNPMKSFLGGPNAAQSENILRSKFGYTDSMINKLKARVNEPTVGGPGMKGARYGSAASDYWSAKSLAEGSPPSKSGPAPVHSAMSQSFGDISKALGAGFDKTANYEGPKTSRSRIYKD